MYLAHGKVDFFGDETMAQLGGAGGKGPEVLFQVGDQVCDQIGDLRNCHNSRNFERRRTDGRGQRRQIHVDGRRFKRPLLERSCERSDLAG